MRVQFEAELRVTAEGASIDRNEVERLLEENSMYEDVNGIYRGDPVHGAPMLVQGTRHLGSGPAATLSGAVASIVSDVEMAAGDYNAFRVFTLEAELIN